MNFRHSIGAVLLATSAVAFAATIAVPFKKGAQFVAARKGLIANGWAPLITDLRMGDGTPAKTFGAAGPLLSAGFREIEGCSGTGDNPCVFNYKKPPNHCLRVVTVGEFSAGAYQPSIYSWSFKCPDQVLR